MRILCSSRKPMRKTPVSGFPRALSSLPQSCAKEKSSGVEIVSVRTDARGILGKIGREPPPPRLSPTPRFPSQSFSHIGAFLTISEPETVCLVTELSRGFWLRNSSLLYKRVPNRVLQSHHPDRNFPSIP